MTLQTNFIRSSGEMAVLTRLHNWNESSLGPAHLWPPELKTTLGIILNSRFPMFLFWGKDAICFYNDAYRPSLGEEGKHPMALGKPAADVWGEIWQDIKPQIDAIMNGGEASWHEDQLLPIYRNGKLENVYWTYSYSPVLDSMGQPLGVFVTCSETTKTVELIQQLQTSNEKARLAIEAGDLGVVEVDLVTQHVSISERIQELFGLPTGTERTAFLKQMHPDDLVLREAAYQRAYKDGMLEYESRVTKKDGSVRWIRLKGTVFFDAAGKPSRMLSVVIDITEQKEFENQLGKMVKQRTEELETAHQRMTDAHDYLQSIINIFTTPLQVLQPVYEQGEVTDFIYQLTNEAYAVYAQKSPADLVGKKVSEFFPGYFNTDSFKNIREVVMTGHPKIWENHYGEDGLDIYNEMGAVMMGDEVVVHLTDFTKLKHLQLELINNNSELKRSNENLEEFAHAASHDLKEPIRKIHFFTSQLKEQLGAHLTETQLRSFERIEVASRRMSTLIEDLLMYSHVSLRPKEMEQINLGEKLAGVIDDLELDIQQSGACVEVAPMPTVTGHRRQLQQLFQNLISNAIKYSREDAKPQVNISASQDKVDGKSYHHIIVEDNGIGFDEAYKEKIFQMFTRLHGKHEYSGTGVGLSIVKKVVENHNGLLHAESVLGKGSKFHVYLPVSS